MMSDSLGDRMKEFYEDRSRVKLLRRTPVIVRVDGRAFHTLTRKAEKPFDAHIVWAMLAAAKKVASEMQGFKLGYVQSDEASFLLTDFDTLQTDAWFDYNLQKIVSIAASIMSVEFNQGASFGSYQRLRGVVGINPVFDARAFNVPNLVEAANYFLWRAKDWERNSVSMFARSFFSHKQLHGKSRTETLAMLEAEGHRWNEVDERYRNGSWLYRGGFKGILDLTSVRPEFAGIDELVTKYASPPSEEEPLDYEGFDHPLR
jgi:tRNA(His) 5'-end guanylyltransferase